ncbi:response regulator transcription factor [Limibacillus halophilus]|uniref:DNA-binding response OmpR family regulator n=1 Tax=Limibacillus halophilus TaxID=1579333 RepID=A0A839SVK1_9PROT|nr:response regulator transcription factor [Limibacillus halophilus]MBB3066502.1 DNA-binding response OmpR family regulator [Limibacillus halophilus]
MQKYIWVLEDEEQIARSVKRYLEREGYLVSTFDKVAKLRASISDELPDAFILDINLPDGNGVALTQVLRELTDKPILLITGRADLEDRIKGLDAGADDYILKPFDLEELAARLRRNISRSGSTGEWRTGEIVVDDITLDRTAGKLSRKNGAVIDLTDWEVKLLHYLMSSPNKVVSREHLYEFARGRILDPDDRSLDVYIHRIRKALKILDPNNERVRTVRGEGYVFLTNE